MITDQELNEFENLVKVAKDEMSILLITELRLARKVVEAAREYFGVTCDDPQHCGDPLCMAFAAYDAEGK